MGDKMKFDWLKRQPKFMYKRRYAVHKSDTWVSTNDESEMFILYTNEPPCLFLQKIFLKKGSTYGKEIFSGAIHR